MAKGKRGMTLATAVTAAAHEYPEMVVDDAILDEAMFTDEDEDLRPPDLHQVEIFLGEDADGNGFLPGVEPVADAFLVGKAKQIKEAEQGRMALAKQESQFRQQALEYMQKNKIPEYRVGGFEITISVTKKVKVRVPKPDDDEF